MKLASYKTERGAQRYAAEIKRLWPSIQVSIVPDNSFRYGVRIVTPSGETAMAGKRPAHYDQYNARNMTLPNDKGL